MRASVVVPVYNDSRIVRCVKALLAQSVLPHQIMVVDDHSDPSVADVLRRGLEGGPWVVEPETRDGSGHPMLMQQIIDQPRVVVARQDRNRGSYAARNLGIALGDVGDPLSPDSVWAFTDADCVPESGWIHALLARFDSPTVAGVAGTVVKAPPRTWVQAATGNLVEHGQAVLPTLPFHPQHGYAVTANVAYRSMALWHVGRFNPVFRSGGDVDLAWRIQGAPASSAGNQQRVWPNELVVAPEAVVQHEGRETLLGLWNQYQGYAEGHALLLLLHRNERAWWLNSLPLIGLATLPVRAGADLLGITPRGSGHTGQERVVEFVINGALFTGNLLGSARHGSFVL